MNIKRFVAKDMREALREIRQTLGPDAVMLSSQPVDGGVEVIAAIDYDDSLLAKVWEPAEEAGPAHRDAARGAATSPSAERDEPLGRASEHGRTYRDVELTATARGPLGREAPAPRLERDLARAAAYTDLAPAAYADVAPAGAYADLAHAAETAARGDDPEPDFQPSPRAASADGRVPRAVPAAARAASAVGLDASSDLAPERGTALAHELKDLRELLQSQLASLAWNDLNRRNPVQARMLRQFTKLGIDPDLARELTARGPATTDIADVWRTPLKLLSAKLLLSERELINLTGVLAVVGPTGVGKTTTIAKMAARFILRHGASQLGLVSTDCYRVGAREQLMTFARIMGVPVQVAGNSEELRQVLDTLRHKRLILIDTAGMSQRDVRLAGQFETLRVQGHKVRTVLTLSAATERASLRDMLEAFDSAAPKALIFTKIDEATTLGPMLSLALRSGLPLAYLAAGQRVPEDLYVAGRQRAWLIQKALRLAQNHKIETREDELAEQFATLEMAANA